jgi:hypothetical protein
MTKIPPGCDLTVMQSITYLTIDPFDLASGYTIDKDLKIGNTKPGADELSEAFAESAGQEDLFQLRMNPTFAYVRNGYDGGTIDEPNAGARLRIFVGKVQLLMHALWLVKDNSANPWRAHLRVDDAGGQHHRVDSFTTQFSMADCGLRTIHFTSAEFDRAVAFYRQLWEVLPQLPENQRHLSGLAHGTRIARAIYFVEAARNTSDLLIKLSFYAMSLETLFTTGDGRHSHDVPQRSSMILAGTRRERQRPYDDIYAMYDYRSDVVHGRKFDDAKLAEVRDTVQRCDDCVRQIVRAILTDPALLALFQTGSSKDISRQFARGSKSELPQRARPPVAGAVDNRP